MAALLAPLVSCGGAGDETVHVATVTMAQGSLAMVPGETKTLKATVEPANATNKRLAWASNSPGVAKVAQDGTVTAVSVGTAVVAASSEENGRMAICNVSVGSRVDGVTVSPEVMALTMGGVGTLMARIEPTNAANKKVTWMSGDPRVAEVDPVEDGPICYVKALTPGRTAISVYTQDGGRMALCDVSVGTGDAIGVTGIEMGKASTAVGMGASETLAATVLPENATIRALRWSSSNPSVAAVSNGTVTAVGEGSATITATTIDGGFSATCDVAVANVHVAGYEYDPVHSTAKIWRNGAPQSLSAGTSAARANSVFVSGGMTYAVGFETEAKSVAKLWINGSPQNLTNGTSAAVANSVFASNGNVYVAGHEEEGKTPTAKLWINGSPIRLSDAGASADAKSVFVTDNNLYYVAGHESTADGGTAARLWTNAADSPPLANGGRDERAMSVHVSDGNVYVAGYGQSAAGGPVARLWINGQPIDLPSEKDSCANAIFVTGDNTYYVVGSEQGPTGRSIAKLWTNGAAQVQNLTNGAIDAEASSVFVVGDGVYVAGSEGYRAKLWLNGAPQALGGAMNVSGAVSVLLR